MKMLRTIVVVLISLSLTLVIGCKDKGEADGEKGEKKAAGAGEIPVAPGSADGVVKESLKAVVERQPAKIYYMLPDSYQKDIQDLKDLALAKLDEETVDNGLKAIGKLMAGLERHKEHFATDGLPVPLPIPKEDLGPAIDTLLKIWAAMQAGGMGTYAGWKDLDIGLFLLAHGETLMSALDIVTKTEEGAMLGMMTAMLSAMVVEVKKSGDEETILMVGMDENKNEMKFVKVEGKWIPEDLQKNWKDGIAAAKEGIEEGLKEYEGQKDSIKAVSAVFLTEATAFEVTGDTAKLTDLFGFVPAK